MITQSPSRHSHDSQRHEPSALTRATGVVVALTVALAVLFVAFALPAVKSAPHDLPVGVAGPPPAVAQIEGALGQNAPGGFAVTGYPDQESLRIAIRNRDVYGGIVADPQGPLLLVASGASPAVAQMLTQIGGAMAEHTGMPLRTEDLAQLPTDDPRGVGLAAAALPLTLAGLLPAIALVFVLRSEVWLRFATTVVFAGVAALTITTLLRYVFGSVDQNFWGITAGLFLGALATGLAVLGLGSLFGRTGLALGAAVALLLGNPLSGLNSAPEMLPRGWGALGQLLPQGANATLLRSTAYFSGAGATTAVVVLSCWAAAGAVLVTVAALKDRKGAT